MLVRKCEKVCCLILARALAEFNSYIGICGLGLYDSRLAGWLSESASAAIGLLADGPLELRSSSLNSAK